MNIEYDPTLVEQAVRLAARRSAASERNLHARIDPLYALMDTDERDRAFSTAFARAFRELGLDTLIQSLLDERPLVAAAVGRCVVCEAARRSAESAELYVRGDDPHAAPQERTLVVQLCAGSLVAPESARPLLRRELLHVHDMLDPGFGYRAADLAALSRDQQIVRDRYRVLWAISVELRLAEPGDAAPAGSSDLRRTFDRAFTSGGCPPSDAEFAAARNIVEPRHQQLLDLARRPEQLREGDCAIEIRQCASSIT